MQSENWSAASSGERCICSASRLICKTRFHFGSVAAQIRFRERLFQCPSTKTSSRDNPVLALGRFINHAVQRFRVHQPEGHLQTGDPLHAEAVRSIVGGIEGNSIFAYLPFRLQTRKKP